MGTPRFAVPSLESLALNTDVVGAYTRPDAVSGRGGARRPSPVKQAALERGLPVFQPPTLRDADAQAQLAALMPDLVVVAAYGLILPQAVLDIPRLGAVNVHASLLPRWRGAAPIQRAILAGDAETGVSIMRMEAGLDTGPFCRVESTLVDDKSTDELTDELAALGAKALVSALPAIEDGTAIWTDQDESKVTYAEKITKSDVAVDPDMSQEAVLRRVRASSAAAPCRVHLGDRTVTVIAAVRPTESQIAAPAAGRVASVKVGVVLGVQDGAVLVTRLKPEGKGEMSAADWARGVRGLDASTWDRSA